MDKDRQPRRAALVTGASRGIGREIALRLASEGFDLTLAARSPAPLTDVAADLGGPGAVHTRAADMSDSRQVRELVHAHDERFGRLDLLVIGAGVGVSRPMGEIDQKGLDLMLDVNLRGPITLVQESLPLLRATASADPDRGARIVAIASLSGVVSEPGLAAYGATKAGLISFCESVTIEESARHVSATAISPGYVDTDMTAWKRGELHPADMLAVGDIAELVLALTRMSAVATVPNIAVTRSGDRIWRA
ncbi:SDR family oxidoreductase [Nocardioides humilatus]|uniref:SDR family oxidoreductase n=1 Tax=Nocardioides humilatus TaxID=2607660 RepID=A0A5B1L893_9ACTN|nr:SDR family oxidoreductase [Nocardioides humilatus]KAA1416941.1 SDR family oxidoreductase [Nocardioides humilatus]